MTNVYKIITPFCNCRGVWLAKKWLQFGFCSGFAKNRFSVRFYKINRGFRFSVRLGLHSSVDVDAIFHLRLYGMTLEMTYFRAALVQLIVSRSDSELEVKRYGMKKILWLLILSCCKMNCEWDNLKNRPQTGEVGFCKPNRRNRVFGFWILRSIWFCSVFRKPISDVFIGFRTPLRNRLRQTTRRSSEVVRYDHHGNCCHDDKHNDQKKLIVINPCRHGNNVTMVKHRHDT